MSESRTSASMQDSICAQRADRRTDTPDPLGSRRVRLSSEDIDDQIRWFFDNAVEGKSLHR